MTVSGCNCAPSVDHTQTRRFMTCLETLTQSLHRSIEDPDLHKTLIEVLLKQITPIVHDLQSTRDINDELTGEIKYLREANAKITNEVGQLRERNESLRITRDRIQENAGWFKKRFDESRETGEELLQAKDSLETKLFSALLREEHLLGRIQEPNLPLEGFMKQLTGKHISLSQIERLYDQNLSKWIDQSAEDYTGTHQGGSVSNGNGVQDVIGQSREISGGEVKAADFGGVGEWASERDKSDLRSEVSIFTDAIKTKIPEYRISKSTISVEKGGLKSETQGVKPVNKKLNLGTTHSSRVKSSTDSNPSIMGAKYISIGALLHEVSGKWKEPAEKRFYIKEPSHDNHPIEYRKGHSPAYQSSRYNQLVNTTKDHTRYVDLTRGGDLWDRDSDTGSINPEFCVADPDEVAGPWNDVPAPLELLQKRTPEKKRPKPVHDCPRGVKLLRLPPKITTAMVSKFVRGGKVTNLVIITDGKKNSVKQALITFLSPKAAWNFHNWVQEFPGSLMVDGLRCLSSIRMSARPPAYEEEVRVLDLAHLPRGIDSEVGLQEFVRITTLEKARRQVPIEEITFFPPGRNRDGPEVSGRVVFEVIDDAILMKRSWESRWGLKVQWGHDQCEEPLLNMDPMRKCFWFHEEKQYSIGSDKRGNSKET